MQSQQNAFGHILYLRMMRVRLRFKCSLLDCIIVFAFSRNKHTLGRLRTTHTINVVFKLRNIKNSTRLSKVYDILPLSRFKMSRILKQVLFCTLNIQLAPTFSVCAKHTENRAVFKIDTTLSQEWSGNRIRGPQCAFEMSMFMCPAVHKLTRN